MEMYNMCRQSVECCRELKMHVNQPNQNSSSSKYPCTYITSSTHIFFYLTSASNPSRSSHPLPQNLLSKPPYSRGSSPRYSLSSITTPLRPPQRHEYSPHLHSSLHRHNPLLLCHILRPFSESLTTFLLYRPHAREYRRGCYLCHVRRLRRHIPSDNWQSGLVAMDGSEKLQAHNVVVYGCVV